MTLEIELNNQYKRLCAPIAGVRALAETLEASGLFPIQAGELSLAFVDDASLAKIHVDFMDDPSPTDVITFPAEASMQSAGEIVISVDRAIEQAAQQGNSLSHELCLYFAHGWLHLAGYQDNSEAAIQRMRAAEQSAMALFAAHKQLDCFKVTDF